MKTQKYKVTFCWFGESHEFFTSTTSKSQALRNSIFKLAKKLQRDLVFVRYQIQENKYLVEEVIE